MIYLWIKQLHLVSVSLSIGFFILRFYWMLRRCGYLQSNWVRPASITIDSLLLCAGVLLMLMSRQYPITSPWLTAKLVALVLYILLGTFALNRGKTMRVRAVTGLLSLITVGYMLAIALTRSAIPWTVMFVTSQ